jgi:hypothetical protein
LGERIGVYSYLPGCEGVSPTGTHWSYVQPQHTGTGSVVRFLYRSGISTSSSCQHDHTVSHSKSVTHSFAFVANPYKRVLSNAVYSKVLENQSDPVRAFRAWVRSQRCAPVVLQTALLACHPVKFVGRTTALARDLRTALQQVGYTMPEQIDLRGKAEHQHCITSCANGTVPTLPLAAWYDEHSLAKVQRWYMPDFEAYGFPLDPSEAEEPPRSPQRDAPAARRRGARTPKERLLEVAELLKLGLISAEEFRSKKMEIMKDV